jgi:hypothetical protein
LIVVVGLNFNPKPKLSNFLTSSLSFLRKGEYAVTSAAKSAGQKVYELTIEKIYPNGAVLMVNDKWRARLTPEEYNGPKALIKKNSRFKATADLYRLGGTLCIRVKEVLEILD